MKYENTLLYWYFILSNIVDDYQKDESESENENENEKENENENENESESENENENESESENERSVYYFVIMMNIQNNTEISILSVLTVCEYHDNSSVMIYRINE